MRQEFSKLFNVFFRPEMYRHASACRGFGFGNFASFDIANERSIRDTKFFGSLTGRVSRHFGSNATDINGKMQVKFAGIIPLRNPIIDSLVILTSRWGWVSV